MEDEKKEAPTAAEEPKPEEGDIAPSEVGGKAEPEARKEGPEAGPMGLEERREQARRRREREQAEREEKIRKEAYEKGLREGRLGSVGKNPYTGQPIADEDDLEVYETMKELDEKGKDPIRDFPSAVSEKARARRKGEAERARKEREEGTRIEADLQDAAARFPEYRDKAKLASLFNDQDFQDYAEGKLGRRPLGDIIEGYRRLSGIALRERRPASGAKTPPSSVGKAVPERSYKDLAPEEKRRVLKEANLIK